MTPIESTCDIRLVTLIGVAINVIEELAVHTDENPELILAEALFLANKNVHEKGEEEYAKKLQFDYPVLAEAIK